MKTCRFFLNEVHLTNFATFTKETIQFQTGFNAIIGETGSGKSLILDAIQLLLGQRADRKIVRKNSEFAIIEGVFEVNDPEIKNFFDQLGYPFDDQVFIKRIIYANGKSKTYLNHQSCNLNLLVTIAKRYIDLVGQFENQKLLSSNYQLILLDSYTDYADLLNKYHANFQDYKEIRKEYSELKRSIDQRAERIDFLDFQIREFESINPSIEEYQELKSKKENYKNKEKRLKLESELSELLHGNDEQAGIIAQINSLVKIADHNAELTNINSDQLFESLNLIESFETEVIKSLDADSEEQDIETIIERLDQIQKLKRKYNLELIDIIAKFDNYAQERNQLQRIEDDIKDKQTALNQIENKCYELAKKLHDKRKAGALKLSTNLTKMIRTLNMAGAEVDIRVSMKEQLDQDGISVVDIFVETNPGEGFYPLKDIASGGELSRILLALRQILSNQDSISVFLFDEIDTGIGGKTALKIGEALKNVSLNSQVISITHLPQIAINADLLISVDKKTTTAKGDPRTHSYIQQVSGAQIKTEVEKMAPL